jgi:serine O-acetyltransferase
MLRELYGDFDTHDRSLLSTGFWALAVYRYGRWAEARRGAVAHTLATKLYGVFRLGVELTTGIVIEPGCQIGDGFHIVHAGNIKIHPKAVIGRRCGVMPDVTVGETIGRDGAPTIGDDVYIGPGARILGPVHIGDGALVAANSLVITDVPAGATAMGVPARILPQGKGAPPRKPMNGHGGKANGAA